NTDTPLQLDISELSVLNKPEYDALEPLQWPIKNGVSATRLFGDGQFATADRRARLIPIEPYWPQSQINRDTPLILNTGRVRDQWHTMTRTAESEKLNRHRAEPYVEVHPQDAAVFGLAAGEIAELSNRHGTAW